MLIDRRRYERKKDLHTAKHFYLEKFHHETNAVDFVRFEVDVIDTHLKLFMQLQCFHHMKDARKANQNAHTRMAKWKCEREEGKQRSHNDGM